MFQKPGQFLGRTFGFTWFAGFLRYFVQKNAPGLLPFFLMIVMLVNDRSVTLMSFRRIKG
jgi:hypothetical protein